MVRSSPAAGPMVVPPSLGVEEKRHGVRSQGLRCAFCGSAGRFLRHETLAHTGQPGRQRRFRALR